MKRQEAERLRELIVTASVLLDDKDASKGAEFFPRLTQNGALVKAGTRINWNGTVKRAAVDLWDTSENTPDAAPTLWEDIAYREGIRIIPQTITATLAFSKDELGWWGNTVYRSKQNGNVWTPGQYANAWELCEGEL